MCVCVCVCVAATAAAKSLQSCLTKCDPIDGSPAGFHVPGILQARTLEWSAISFSMCVCTYFNFHYPFIHLWTLRLFHLKKLFFPNIFNNMSIYSSSKLNNQISGLKIIKISISNREHLLCPKYYNNVYIDMSSMCVFVVYLSIRFKLF